MSSQEFASLWENIFIYLAKCNRHTPTLLTRLVITVRGHEVLYGVTEGDEVLVEYTDLEAMAIWLKHYVSWEED